MGLRCGCWVRPAPTRSLSLTRAAATARGCCFPPPWRSPCARASSTSLRVPSSTHAHAAGPRPSPFQWGWMRATRARRCAQVLGGLDCAHVCVLHVMGALPLHRAAPAFVTDSPWHACTSCLDWLRRAHTGACMRAAGRVVPSELRQRPRHVGATAGLLVRAPAGVRGQAVSQQGARAPAQQPTLHFRRLRLQGALFVGLALATQNRCASCLCIVHAASCHATCFRACDVNRSKAQCNMCGAEAGAQLQPP